MIPSVTVKLIDDNGTAAPIFYKFTNQVNPQPAYLEFDPASDGDIVLEAAYSSEIGNGMPANVWNRQILRFRVSSNVSRDALEELNGDEGLAATLQMIREGYFWRYGAARYTDQAEDAIAVLERRFETLEQIDVWGAEEWVYDSLNLADYIRDPAQWILDASDNTDVVVIGDISEAARIVSDVKFDHICYRADAYGSVEILPGVFFVSSETMLADQDGWEAEDLSKTMDFSTSEYWITTSGKVPEGVNTLADLIEAIK